MIKHRIPTHNVAEASISFFTSVANTQLHHWTRWVVITHFSNSTIV